MLEAYQRRIRPQGLYFRELYALWYNINRGEKTPPIDGADVLSLPGDKKARQTQRPRIKKRTQTEWDDLITRIKAA